MVSSIPYIIILLFYFSEISFITGFTKSIIQSAIALLIILYSGVFKFAKHIRTRQGFDPNPLPGKNTI